MKKHVKTLMSLLVVLLVISLAIGETHAFSGDNDDSELDVGICSAYYLDLDEDGIKDDIMTNFTIDAPDDCEIYFTIIYCTITLPSGTSFYHFIIIDGSFCRIQAVTGWYNTAIESGWYLFQVNAWSFGYDAPSPGYDSLVFDPPTDGEPGPPVTEDIIIIVET